MGSKSAIGIGNGICFKQVRDKGGGSYIDPLVRDSIVGLWKFDQNTNESPTRNIIKNTIKDKGGDLELLNFGYKLNSGYGGYIEDFSLFILSNRFEYSEISDTKITITAVLNNSTGIYHSVTEEDSALYWNTFKIKVSGSTDDVYIRYSTAKKNIRLYNGINTVVVPNELSWHSFSANKVNTSCNITLEFVPLYEGALVTDGKDDLITSTKTVKEMLGGSNEVTVVSMVHHIGLSSLTTINNIRSESVAHVVCRNICSSVGKTGIYGYSKQINTNNPPTLINNILGDKKDYTAEGSTALDPTDKFFVQGYKYSGTISEVSPIACYWTFISNKTLTTDQINQVISYFNLDKHVKPDVYYDVKKQGLSNDTPEADWCLKDFSGNGHDMQLYNFAKKLGSGIGKYEVDYSTWTKTAGVISTPFGLKITEPTHNYWILYTSNITVPAHKVKISGIPEGGEFRYLGIHILKNGINELPKMEEHPSAIGFTLARGTTQPSDWVGLSVEQIPDYEGALVSDGINDYGYADNLPIYKDYTVVADYARLKYGVIDSAIVSKSYIVNNGAFAFNLASGISPKNVSVISFGVGSPQIQNDDNYRKIRYQSKYINDSVNISAGTGIDSDKLWISCLRENKAFSESALYSILLFPYTLSEFLLERQLKRYKLGTLYPDMVEFRPVISGNIPYNAIEISQGSTTLYNKSINKTGIYLQEGSTVRVYIQPSGIDEVSKITINGVEYTDLPINPNGYYYVDFPITKSPQKISYAIDEYIRYEDIVQPYPAIINLKQDGKTITWGDKLKVGSEVTFVNHTNLLPDLYTVSGGVQYNGTYISWNTSIRVEKSMVFVNPHNYKKANEPNCILAPQTLRIPNSSYKILGYIPDLTGKGNHGVINNSAYVGMSGANGYVYNWNTWRISKSGITSTITDNSLHITSLKGQYNPNHALFETNTVANTGDKSNFKVNITGLTSNIKCTFNNAGAIIKELVNGVNEISVDLVAGWYGFMITALDNSVIGDCDITIQQIGQYEGSFCLDGVDDFITIPTLSHGAKQVLMKVNLQSYDRYLYDQRNIWSQYLAIVSASKTIAYEYSNKGGKTYIDGILNEHIIDKDLLNITHNITATNANIGVQYAPNIGTSFARSNFAQMALFDFMLFPEISSEEEIQELNDIVGIEGGYVESPDYYWDAYGKKNTDTDRNLIADQVSKDVANALEVKNVAYNSESGYTDDNSLLLDGVEDYAVNTVIPAVTDFTVIAKREFPESALVNNQTFLVKGDAINGNNNVNSLLMECYYGAQNYIISFSYQQIVPLEESKISWITPTSYNGNALTKGSGIDSAGLTIGRYRDLYRKAVFYKLMLYTKTIDQLSINMLKNLFERDELIDITNPIFKKEEL